MLERISPENIKDCSLSELKSLCGELRETICDTVGKCGGHLASNLGAVESTVALFYVFDFPKDKIIFDVGHQCYPYKLLSGRYSEFSTLRQRGGISGFPKRCESVYDCYDTGHAGTSVSAAIGFGKARDLAKEDHCVIAYIGDGSFNNGLVYEALNSLKIVKTNVLIVLNDNGMSISPTIGGMYDIISEIRKNEKEENIRLLESFGLSYMGVKDGNDLQEMIEALREGKAKLATISVLLHIETKKGKGYEFSEEHPTDTHGISPVGASEHREYSQILGEKLRDMAARNEKVVVVAAAMKEALGLSDFFEAYPQRALDVGICEENAAVLCASMAAGGLKPYYAIYSTFLQRSFDEIIHDVCGQDLPVTFCIDRAGISGSDGETHQGVFDLSYLSLIPNLAIIAPKDTEELKEALEFSLTYAHPLAIRYPRTGNVLFKCNGTPIRFGKWEYLHQSVTKVTVLAVGERCLRKAMEILEECNLEHLDFNVVNARFVKPLDESLLETLQGHCIVTLEDNVLKGGFGALVDQWIMQSGISCTVKNFAYDDCFIPHGGVEELQREYGLDQEEVARYIRSVLL